MTDVHAASFCMSCGHIFCSSCLESILEQVSLCPSCRQQLVGRTALSLALLSLLRTNECFWTISHRTTRVATVVWPLLWLVDFATPMQCMLIFCAIAFFEGHMTGVATQRFKQMEKDLEPCKITLLVSEITITVVVDFVMISTLLYYIQDLFVSKALRTWGQLCA